MPPPKTAHQQVAALKGETPKPKTNSKPTYGLPPKSKKGLAIVINGVEGVGKTTLGAMAPDSVILMARGETGYLTLYQYGRVPERKQMTVNTWPEVLAAVDSMLVDPQGSVYVLDAMGGFERLCHEHVCDTKFGGDWGKKGFLNYQEGFTASVTEWLKLIIRLENIQREHGIHVVLLSHCKVQNYKNPLGPDYDRFVADCHKMTWDATKRWVDTVLFYTFHTVVDTSGDKSGKRGKGIGGTERRIYTQWRDAFDAKERFGMPEMIQLTGGHEKSWEEIARHIFKEQG